MNLKTKLSATALALAVLSVSTVAWAQRAGVIRGGGAVGCGEFLEDSRNDRYKQYYTQWVQGYLSGYSIYSSQPATREIPDEATIDAYLQKHCRDNPLDKVVRAAVFLIGDLGGLRPPK